MKTRIETYEIVLNHYMNIDGKKIKIDEPIIVQQTADHNRFTYNEKTFIINDMLFRLSSYVLQMVEQKEKEE